MNLEKKRKTSNLLSVCIKAGKAIKGFDSAKDAVTEGKAYAILTACDSSEKTVKEIRFVCQKYNVPVLMTELEKAEIGKLVGKDTAIIAVCDKGFAEGFKNLLS